MAALRDKDISPERTKVWAEPPRITAEPSRSTAERRVAVVYYLCRNGELQHPHFMEVPLSSPRGLFLRDVIGRLNSLRGEGMAYLYSWSAKRKYNKNGFVWQDLEGNDFIYPTHGHEYILKGSELMIHSSEETAQLTDVRKSGELTVTAWRRHANRVHNTELLTDKPPINQEKVSDRSRSTGEISTPPSSSSSPETLAALMKADRRFIFVNEARKDPTMKPKASSSSVVMQILSCGSMAVRGCAPPPCTAALPPPRRTSPNETENADMEIPLIASIFRSL